MKIMHRTGVLLASLAIMHLVSASRAVGAEVRGTVASVDAAKNELKVEGRGAERGSMLVFALGDKTLVLFGSEKATVADLRPGRRVRVEFEETADGQKLARVIHAIGRVPAQPVAATPALPMASGDAVTGVLQRVSRSDREVVVIGPGPKGAETESTVAVPEGTKIVKEGKPVSLESLKEGDAVAVRVERHDGRLTALEMQAGPGATLSASPAPERGRLVPRVRQALHIADEVLKRLDAPDPDPKSPKKP
jgi:cold shock CspA family protein